MIPHVPYSRRTFSAEPGALKPARAGKQADLHSQFEELLDSVWKAEADWRFNDRLDLALKSGR